MFRPVASRATPLPLLQRARGALLYDNAGVQVAAAILLAVLGTTRGARSAWGWGVEGRERPPRVIHVEDEVDLRSSCVASYLKKANACLERVRFGHVGRADARVVAPRVALAELGHPRANPESARFRLRGFGLVARRRTLAVRPGREPVARGGRENFERMTRRCPERASRTPCRLLASINNGGR